MTTPEPATGGGRWMEVTPDRVARWLAGFDEQHHVTRSVYGPETVVFEAADGALAECHPPFPPLAETGEHEGLAAQPLVAHAQRERVVGVLLVRLGGHAAGVFEGDRLVASKVGSRPVHGRHANGGWSQARFGRRREEQSRAAAGAATDVARRVLLPRLADLQAVVLGGDRRAVDALRDDPELKPVFERAVERFLTLPDPKLTVLRTAPMMFRAVRIRLVEPDGRAPDSGQVPDALQAPGAPHGPDGAPDA